MGSCNSGGKGNSMSVLILGTQGEPKTPDEALANTNPNREQGREYQFNCQRCIYAYELQRQGYDVEAKPRIFSDDDPMNYGIWMNGFVNQKWERNLGTMDTEVENTIVSKMQGWGDGSRGIIYVAWQGGNSHVANVENKAGNVTIYDGQTGKTHTLSDFLSIAQPSSTMISRVDNLKPNVNVLKHAVKKRESKL